MQSTTDSQRRSEAPFPEIWGTVSGHVQVLAFLDGISGKLTELAAAIEPLLPPEPGPLSDPVASGAAGGQGRFL